MGKIVVVCFFFCRVYMLCTHMLSLRPSSVFLTARLVTHMLSLASISYAWYPGTGEQLSSEQSNLSM